MILINLKMPIRPDKMDEWLALTDSYAKDVNSEDGCLFFQFARSLTDDNEFVCIEGFTDAEAGATHVKQPYVKKFFNTAPGLVGTPPRLSSAEAEQIGRKTDGLHAWPAGRREGGRVHWLARRRSASRLAGDE